MDIYEAVKDLRRHLYNIQRQLPYVADAEVRTNISTDAWQAMNLLDDLEESAPVAAREAS